MGSSGRFSRQDETVALEATDRALLDAVFSQSVVGVAVWSLDLRYVRVNSALAAMNGMPPEEHVGRHVSEVVPDVEGLLALLEQVRDTGRATREIEVTGETPAEPGRRRWWLATYYALRDPEGAILGVGGLVREITKRKEAELELERRERHASFLAQASATLAESLDFKETLRTAARLAVPAIADWCVVDVVQDDGSLQRIALAHTDPDKENLAWELTRRYPSGPAGHEGTPKTIRSSTREIVPELRDSFLERLAQDDDHLEMLRDLGLRSLMTVPLRARGRTFGAMAFVAAAPERRFDRHDLTLAENLAARAALAADNARLFGEREHIAAALQRSLLPPSLPQIEGVEMVARYRPAGNEGDVGGDFYDVFPTPDGVWGIAIGDVVGKGPDAAAVTALARHTLHVAAAYERLPSRVLTALNDALLEAEDSPRRLLTAAYVRLVADSGVRIEAASAGHPLPLIVRAGGGVETVATSGTLLGFVPDPRVADCDYELAPGDTLVLYTDGVIETRPIAQALGPDGLAELLESCAGWSAEAIAELIEGTIEERSEGWQTDDVALLVVRVLPR